MYMDVELDTPASVCDKINEASLVYADALNADLSTYMKRLVNTFDLPKSSYTIAPYAYFYYKGFDVDIKNEMIPHSYDEEEPIALYDPDDVDRGRIATNYQAVLDNYAKGWRKAKTILGLVGITMVTTGEDDPDDQSAQVKQILELVWQRPIEQQEIDDGIKLISQLQQRDGASLDRAVATFALVAINSNEFLYLD